MTDVRATVRLQFHRAFTLHDAVPLVAYFKQLGISHIYASPLLKARSGSVHGYDVVDPTCVNPEIGGEAGLVRLVAELRKHHMGLLADMVSNHMAVGGDDNPWWQDVLCWGLQSPYAHFFDIQWNSPDPLLKGQLLLPFLGAGYGETLAANEISLHFDAAVGVFYAQYFDHRFPLNPISYGHILGKAEVDSMRMLAHTFEELEGNPDARAAAPALYQQLSELAQNAEVAVAIANAISFYDVALGKESALKAIRAHAEADVTVELDELDPQDNDNFQRLHQLLELQPYRLASWRTAADDINWRRFFDVNELAGLRVERPEVFAASHRKILELIERGLVDGLRIDHIDGLANPRAYCRKLRRWIGRIALNRPGERAQDYIPIYVEKILGEGEQLATGWQVDGTTGYEFMNQVSLLQHDPKGELPLTDLWRTTTERVGSFTDEAKEARRLVLATGLAGDLEMVAQGLLLIARDNIATRDFTLGSIRRALIELVVNFSVYRTYASVCGRAPEDQVFFQQALTGARQTVPESDWPLLDNLDAWLGGEGLHTLPPSPARELRHSILVRFQQLTSPTAAKAVEDTACYRSAVLLSRNDVGFNPQCFSSPVAEFHQQTLKRAAHFPHNLLTTATHDHKRGEDTRARIAVISERAAWFSEKIQYWRSLAEPLRVQLDEGIAPSAGDELILYQTLLGTWPLTLAADDADNLQSYRERLLDWQEKSVREAKLRSTWNAPNTAYETAVQDFLTRLLSCNNAALGDKNTATLRADIAAAAQTLAPAGALNSLSQTLLRMSAPGVPDLYQGNEFWDFSLVDPDNRRPVDFEARIAALKTMAGGGANKANQALGGQLINHLFNQLINEWRDGRIKQWLIYQTLNARAQHHELFHQGDYQPLTVEGEQAEHVVAFIRRHQKDYLVVVVPRLSASLLGDSPVPHIPPAAWGDTKVLLPPELSGANFTSPLGAHPLHAHQTALPLETVLANFPVNFLLFTASH